MNFLIKYVIFLILCLSLVLTLAFYFILKDPVNLYIDVVWTPPTQFMDDTPLNLGELERYKLTWREVNSDTSHEVYIPINKTNYLITGLDEGRYHIALTAISVYGTESEPVIKIKELKQAVK